MTLSTFGGFSVLQNTILGPGLLGLPWAFAQCGLCLGVLMLLVSFFVGFAGMHLLAASSVATSTQLDGAVVTIASMSRCAHRTSFGKFVRISYELGLVLAAGGALITSLMIIG